MDNSNWFHEMFIQEAKSALNGSCDCNNSCSGESYSGVHIGPDEPTDGSTIWVDTDEN